MYVHINATADNNSTVAFNLNMINVLRDVRYDLTTFACLYTYNAPHSLVALSELIKVHVMPSSALTFN